MVNSLFLIYLLPFFGATYLSLKKENEATVRKIIPFVLLPPLLTTLFFIVYYFYLNFNPLHFDFLEVHFKQHHISFSIYLDHLSLIILFLTGYLSVVVTRLSHVYLHRETGYQRFFKTLCLFVFGLQILALAGTLDLFFAGWEIIGFSSFLLIAFYRNRTRPVKNAFRIYAIYRIADVGLLLSAIVGHVLWKNADHFYSLISDEHLAQHVQNPIWFTVLGLLLTFAAIGKSAQFPFINWPARAMEGPTPSSAIFYGALSIHCGVFLLYRTYSIWKNSPLVVMLICGVGLTSILFASMIGRVQSNIKGQLAYASVTQIGFMFIETALGWHKIVLVHITLHCLLRCYQLLVSPSAIVEHIKTINRKDISENNKSFENLIPKKMQNTIYSFCFQEGFLSISERAWLLLPAVQWKFFLRKMALSKWIPALLISFILLVSWLIYRMAWNEALAYFYASLCLILSIHCLVSLRHPQIIWNRFLLAQVLFNFAIYFINPESVIGIQLFAISAIPCWLCGYFALKNLGPVDMKIFNGLYVLSPRNATLFFIAFIGLSGLPFTTVFWAEDIIIAEIILQNPTILALTTLSLMLNGLISARILVKTFWGFPMYIEY